MITCLLCKSILEHKIAYPQVFIGRLTLICNGLATSSICFINIMQVYFEYEDVLLNVQLQLQQTYNTHEKHDV